MIGFMKMSAGESTHENPAYEPYLVRVATDSETVSLLGPVKYILVGVIILCAAFLALACAWYCTKEPFKIRAREMLKGQIMEGLRRLVRGLRFRRPQRRRSTMDV